MLNEVIPIKTVNNKCLRTGNTLPWRIVSIIPNKKGSALIPRTVGRPAMKYQYLKKN